MTPNPVTLREDDMIAYVLTNMHVGGYRHVPIVTKDYEPVTVVSVKNVVSFVLDQFPKEIVNQLDQPYRGQKSLDGG